MNWKRGLFRAWLLVSVLWIAVVSAIGIPSIHRALEETYLYRPAPRTGLSFPSDGTVSEKDHKRPYYEIFLSPKDSVPATFDVANYQMRSDLEGKGLGVIRVNFPDGSRLYITESLTAEDAQYVAGIFWERRWSRWWDAGSGWVLAVFLPPTLMLGLGGALLWVLTGFRSKP